MIRDEREATSRGGPGRDVFPGTRRDDTYAGRGGNDVINGRGGTDVLKGNGGRDLIRGGGGDDELSGGNGNDVLHGNRGNDIVTGGAGADTFVLAKLLDAFDTITDFSLEGGDRLRLTGLLKQAPAGADAEALLRVEQSGEGAVLAAAPAGDGQFQDLVLLEGVTIGLAELIDAGAIIGLPNGSDGAGLKARRDQVTTGEDASLELDALLGNDGGTDLAIVSVDTSRTVGQVTLQPDGTVLYDPAGFDRLPEGATATDRFDYTVEDGRGGSDTARVKITVEGVNDRPQALSLTTQTAREAGSPLTIDLRDHFADPDDGARLDYEATRAGGGKLPDWLSLEDGVVSGKPGPFDRGDVSVRLTATDEHGASESTTFTVETVSRQAPGQPQQSARAPNLDGSTDSTFPDTSETGRFVVFAFDEPNPESDEFSEIRSIRLKDFATDQTYELFEAGIDVFTSGPSISADGRTVAFYTDEGPSVRVLTIDDLGPLTVTPVLERGVAASFTTVSLSENGEVVAFSDGSDLAVVNLATGVEATIAGAGYPSLSADGSRIAFIQPNGDGFDVAAATIATGSMTISGRTPLAAANGFTAPSISGNGMVLAFESSVNGLVAGDRDDRSDVFLYDFRQSPGSEIRIVSADAQGHQSDLFASSPSISSDGSRVAFVASTGSGEDDQPQILAKETGADGELRLVSVNLAGDPGNQSSSDPGISPDGRFVAYTSGATNLTPDAADNAGRAVFLTPVDASFTSEVDYPAPEPPPSGADGPAGSGEFGALSLETLLGPEVPIG